MFVPVKLVVTLMSMLWARLQHLRRDERGMTTEAIIITALLAGVALFAVGAIVTAIQNKTPGIANDIEDPGPQP